MTTNSRRLFLANDDYALVIQAVADAMSATQDQHKRGHLQTILTRMRQFGQSVTIHDAIEATVVKPVE